MADHVERRLTRRQFAKDFAKGGGLFAVGCVPLFDFFRTSAEADVRIAAYIPDSHTQKQVDEATQRVAEFRGQIDEFAAQGRLMEIPLIESPQEIQQAYQVVNEDEVRQKYEQKIRSSTGLRQAIDITFAAPAVLFGALRGTLAVFERRVHQTYTTGESEPVKAQA